MKKDLKDKALIVFDLDGTLAPSKAIMEPSMRELFVRLLAAKRVAVIGGGKYALFKGQLLAALKDCPRELLKNLFLFPTTATAFYKYDRGWKNVYRLTLPARERAKIKAAFKEVIRESGYVPPKKVYGKVIEDRGTQVTFSALGQDIVAVLGKKGIALKDEWKAKNTPMKLKMAKMLAKRLPHLEVHAAGHTSIDVTKKGIDKAYGLHQIEKRLKVPIREMVFIGDALFPGGNDFAAKKTGVDCIAVAGPHETEQVIRKILQ